MKHTYTFNSRENEARRYTYDPDTGEVTNHRNSKVVNIGRGIDFRTWLRNIGASNVKEIS